MKHNSIDCACLIHSTGYDWQYVETLYSMLTRNSSYHINLHVFTEPDRAVPDTMIRHDLEEWPGLSGPRKSWWYKMQMFNSEHFAGPLLYFDLDVVLVNSIDWIPNLDANYFWAIHDFKHLFKPTWKGINSSVMYWDTKRFDWIWKNFSTVNLIDTVRRYQGDQDFLNTQLTQTNRNFFPEYRFRSWRWQVNDGGMDFSTRTSVYPGTGAHISNDLTGIICHGSPKPHEISDPSVLSNWNLDK